jgi:VIT1/CCC1 family predicted Fe2+/Mn2+ transporter
MDADGGLDARWRAEMNAAFVYRAVAAAEPEERLRRLFTDLARAAEAQAGTWEAEARRGGVNLPAEHVPSLRARLIAALVRRLGGRRMRPLLAAFKVRGVSVWDAPAPAPEHPMPRTIADVGRRHARVGDGGSLRAAVFGVNDGLVSNTSLILGVAGAQAEPSVVLLSGAAGLLAGAFSMAAGEWVSMRSQRELFEHQISLEREELRVYPEQEAEELALIYEARGLPLAKAREIARTLMADPERALDALTRDELGLNPDDLGSPWRAATSSFAAFAVGASLPLVPFAIGLQAHALGVAAAISTLALFGVGAALSLFTGRSAFAGGVRMVAIGGAAGVATWAIGRLLGVTLS